MIHTATHPPTRSQESPPHSSSVAGAPSARRRVTYTGPWKQSTARPCSAWKPLIHGGLVGGTRASRPASRPALVSPPPHRARSGWRRRTAAGKSRAERTACTMHTSRHTKSRGDRELIIVCIIKRQGGGSEGVKGQHTVSPMGLKGGTVKMDSNCWLKHGEHRA